MFKKNGFITVKILGDYHCKFKMNFDQPKNLELCHITKLPITYIVINRKYAKSSKLVDRTVCSKQQ